MIAILRKTFFPICGFIGLTILPMIFFTYLIYMFSDDWLSFLDALTVTIFLQMTFYSVAFVSGFGATLFLLALLIMGIGWCFSKVDE